jgi:hypothetical protein
VTVLIGVLGLAGTGALLWRSEQRRQARGQFESTAANVTATLGTELRRDADFVTTIQALATMEPRLSNSAFNAWYESFQGRKREVGSIGTALVESVSAAGLSPFQLRRNSDTAYSSLLGRPIVFPSGDLRRYCLISAVAAIVPLDPSSARWMQSDWCAPGAGAGQTIARLLRAATDSGEYVSVTMQARGLPTMFVGAPVYRRGAPLTSVAERRGASTGWVISTFDVSSVVSSAIGSNHGLAVTLEHRNPGGPWLQIGAAGARVPAGSLSQASDLTLGGDWRVIVRGTAAARGMTAGTEAATVFTGGALLAVLLFLLLLALSHSRNRALWMVEERTGQLRRQELGQEPLHRVRARHADRRSGSPQARDRSRRGA